jgi:hypothetical protein
MFYASWGKKLKPLGYAGIEKCGNCKNYCNFWISEHASQVKAYFIQVAKFNKKFLYHCEICDASWEIPAGKKDEMLRCSTALPTPENCWHLWDCLNDAVTTAARAATNGDLSEKISAALKDQLQTLSGRFPRDHVAYVGRQYLEFLHDEDRPA